MSTPARTLLFALSFWFAGCQLVVDFPPLERDAGGGRSEAGAGDAEAGSDAAQDASQPPLDGESASDAGHASTDGPASTPDAQREGGAPDGSVPVSCEPASHGGCAPDELCCGAPGSAACQKSSASACSACGIGCTDPLAPHCTGRMCECEAGTQRGCAAGQRCMGAVGAARCVECAADADCATTPGRGQCVTGKCVQCDRGPIAEGSADDEGCSQATPICNVENRCVACVREPDDCPGDLFCNGERGCLRCDALRPIGANGCTATTPVCRLGADGGAQCAGCLTNAECGAGGFCDTVSGTCTNVCDPDGPLGDNGCAGATPYCAASGTGFACRGCTALDCTGATPFCALTGARAGSCVACRDVADCAADVMRPICDAAGASCRARTVTDCAGATPVLVNGACVECSADAQCLNVAGRPYCNATTNTCVPCSALPSAGCSERSTATPYCNAVTGSCARCLRNTDCSAILTPTNTPICLNSTCVACNAPGIANPAAACAAELGGLSCITTGPEAGRCGVLPMLPL